MINENYPAFIAALIILASLFLVGCHKNPLMNEKKISWMKQNFFVRGPNFPIDKCADYYSGVKQDDALKKLCETWTQKFYHESMRAGSIPSTTTLQDFRDPAFWKKVNASQGETDLEW
ncbi:hypothetical protein [Rickettsiella endosymbiont of Dermanyssus gallinae]|uniref:hypothetical protein n=1 Tax=Rickettsiella endosymbiont of Dermanyssus gallinae TaxID=2856608 RepID=UPI001C52BD55|nr:hypothetical protein [Rickettsiella endosymbiont of Dermanyssus gallinae]